MDSNHHKRKRDEDEPIIETMDDFEDQYIPQKQFTSSATSYDVMTMLQQIITNQNTILEELRQQKKEILEIKDTQKVLVENSAKQAKKIVQLQVFVEKISSVVCVGKAAPTNPPDGFVKLAAKQDLDVFNERLEDVEYSKNMHEWLDSSMEKGDMKSRMSETRDMIFCPELFACCSWKGGPSSNPKIPLATYTNLLELFRLIGSNSYCQATNKDVEEFLKLKLRYGKDRLNLKTPK